MGSKILQKCTYVADIGIETLKQKWIKNGQKYRISAKVRRDYETEVVQKYA